MSRVTRSSALIDTVRNRGRMRSITWGRSRSSALQRRRAASRVGADPSQTVYRPARAPASSLTGRLAASSSSAGRTPCSRKVRARRFAAAWPDPAARAYHASASPGSRGRPRPNRYMRAKACCACGRSCAAARRSHRAARRRSAATPRPWRYANARLYWATAWPWRAARRQRSAAFEGRSVTPRPVAYNRPRLVWASR